MCDVQAVRLEDELEALTCQIERPLDAHIEVIFPQSLKVIRVRAGCVANPAALTEMSYFPGISGEIV